MISQSDINKIYFLKNKKIINRLTLSTSFGIKCEKITLNNGKKYILKYYYNKISKFNSIISEGKSLNFFQKNCFSLFPKIKALNSKILLLIPRDQSLSF